MTKAEAKKQLIIGYIIFIIAFILGFSLDKKAGLPPLAVGYIVWSTFWGYKLLYKRLKGYSTNTPVKISANGVFDYFQKVSHFRWVTELFFFFICYVVGNLGGSIYMQIKLSKIAYF